jgi:hypothetical protein
LCAPNFIAPKNGERDQRLKNIAFTVENDCRCGRKYLGTVRLIVFQLRVASKLKVNQKQNLKAAFNATIKVNLKYLL